MSETNSSLHANEPPTKKSLFSVFQDFFASTNKIFILVGGLGTRVLINEILKLS